MNQEEQTRFRRFIFVFMRACMIGGIALATATYIFLPQDAVFAIAAVVALFCCVLAIFTWRNLRRIIRSRNSN